jgi:zinc/manganese transport system substrate-binding protein
VDIKRSSVSVCIWTVLAMIGGLATACGSLQASQPSTRLTIVAGENFWGSIAAQLGGSAVAVTSIVTNPNTDPHEYESNTRDARAFADAKYVILNGAGYDDWGKKLLAANPADGRRVLVVADLLGKKPGDNPHFWYSPDFVERVANRITADLKSVDPGHAATFDRQRAALTTALQPYHDRIAAIRGQSAGRKVGATENIFVYLADALGLDLISPPEFMQAVAEGTDPPASTVAEFQQQVSEKQIGVLVVNTQTTTAVTTNLKQLAVGAGIPVVGISETLQPVGASFQAWQNQQLHALQAALTGAR